MMIITWWGENNPKEDNLHEYAYKEWGGMMKSFYRKRWEIYFDYLAKQLEGQEATAPGFFKWERDWSTANEMVKYESSKLSVTQVVYKIL